MESSEDRRRKEKICRKPLGLRFLESTGNISLSFRTYQIIVLIFTFAAYASYHAARKTTSIVRSVLDPESGQLNFFSWERYCYLHSVQNLNLSVQKGWAPFDGASGTEVLGEMDLAFLSVYAIGMYFAGHFGDRYDLRNFLTIGMMGTGLFTSLFGLGYWLNIHNYYYFLICQISSGLFQSTGWPLVVAIVVNWFGKRKRGLIMGIWTAHTSVGNIAGSLIASLLLKYGWGWSFLAPSLLISTMGLMVFLFLPVCPADVGFEKDGWSNAVENNKIFDTLLDSEIVAKQRVVPFTEAWKIPGVTPFALCLFFSKLVAYTFLYWLPFYISRTAIDGVYLSNATSGKLSTIFDVGGVMGGVLAGHISDQLDARAITAASFTYCAIPALFFYWAYGDVSIYVNIFLMFVAGLFVNGPYALITTAVSADLGMHESLKGNSRALATVTAIIDGTGSIGAAIGPLVTGYISTKSWDSVFMMLMISALAAGLLLTRLVMAEIRSKIRS